MFIRAKGIIQSMSAQVVASPLIKQRSTSEASAAREKHAAPLNHLQHNRRAHTIHKIQ